MSKTLYALTIPAAAYKFSKGNSEGFIVEFGSTNCFVDEATFHKHFIPADQIGHLRTEAAPPAAPVANALPQDLDPSLLADREEWQVRVIVEAHELSKKVDKLNDYIKSDAFDQLSEEEQTLLLEQLGAQQELEKVLLERVKRF